mgnify:CR=1 FL=1
MLWLPFCSHSGQRKLLFREVYLPIRWFLWRNFDIRIANILKTIIPTLHRPESDFTKNKANREKNCSQKTALFFRPIWLRLDIIFWVFSNIFPSELASKILPLDELSGHLMLLFSVWFFKGSPILKLYPRNLIGGWSMIFSFFWILLISSGVKLGLSFFWDFTPQLKQ